MSLKWCPLKCTNCSPRAIKFILLGFLALVSSSSAWANPKRIPELLEKIETKYTKASTLTANFSQVTTSAAFGQKKTSTGVIFFKRPSKIRWETMAPDPSLMVSDGRKFWFYTPPFSKEEHGQVIERAATGVQSKLANALLSGAFSVAGLVKIKQMSPTRFQLVPLPGTADTVERAYLIVDPNTKLIQEVDLEHKGGNHSEITLSKITMGPELADQLFVFVPPPNTDRVTE